MEKVVVITGGGSGLGLACAYELGKEGYTVLISGTNEGKLISAKEKLEKEGVSVAYAVADVSNPGSVNALLQKAMSLGQIWAVVNAAGVAPPRVKSEETIIDVNALGAFNVSEAFYPKMAKGGTILNVASICAYQIPRFLRPKHVYRLAESNLACSRKKMIGLSRIFGKKQAANLAYAISKCFVVYFCKKASKRFYESNEIRLLSISPSNFSTEMGNADMKERPGDVDRYLNNQAIAKSGDPKDFGFLVKCLIDQRMALLTGSDIHLDGGWHGYNGGKVRW